MSEETFEIELPSRMIIEASPWLSPDLTRLNKTARANRGATLAPFYDAISWRWRRTLASGPYGDVFKVGDAKPERPWKRMLMGDVLAALKEMRAQSADDTYWIPFTCPRCGDDDKLVAVPLSELKLKRLSDEAFAKVSAGDPFSATIAGRTIGFDLQFGRHADDAQELLDSLKRDKRNAKLDSTLFTRSTPSLLEDAAVRIRSIDGVAKSAPERWAWVCSLKFGQVSDLRDAFDEHDCGVSTDHDVQCTACERMSTIDVPLVAGRYFWTRPTPELILRSSSPHASRADGSISEASGTSIGSPSPNESST